MIPLRDIVSNALPAQNVILKSPEFSDLSPDSMLYSGMEHTERFSALATLADALSILKARTIVAAVSIGLVLSAVVAFS